MDWMETLVVVVHVVIAVALVGLVLIQPVSYTHLTLPTKLEV